MTPATLPTVSVIIPAYNAEPFLAEAIRSVLSQSVPPLEVLVVDDGSRDRTLEVARGFPAPVRAFGKRNGGPASARNLGAREAHGEWLAFLDADDTWLPEKLERQLDATADPRVGVVHSSRRRALRGAAEPVDFPALWARNRIINSTALVRRTAFDAVGGLDEDRALVGVEDYNLWLRLAAAGWAFADCPGEWVRYSPTEGSLSKQYERFVAAELANAAKIAEQLRLDSRELRSKQLRLRDEYGRVLLHHRHVGAARELLGTAFAQAPSPSRLLWLAAAHTPTGLLNLRRRRTASAV